MPAVNQPRVDVQREEERPHGWWYAVALTRGDGSVTRHEVLLNWADHEYWSGGAEAPSSVVERVLLYVLDAEAPPELPEKFDLARVRRFVPGIDRELHRR